MLLGIHQAVPGVGVGRLVGLIQAYGQKAQVGLEHPRGRDR